MANTELFIEARAQERPRSHGLLLLRDLLALTKPRITTMVMLTGAAGACLAPAHVHARALLLAINPGGLRPVGFRSATR